MECVWGQVHVVARVWPGRSALMLRWLLALACLALIEAGCEGVSDPASGGGSSRDEPNGNVESLSQWESLSESGRYRVALRPEEGAARIGRLHAWIVRISSQEGKPVRPSRLAFNGGMPQHGHGFQTAPRVTRALGDGAFRVDGVRFHMSGEWTLRVEFVGAFGPDVAVFEITVEP